MTPASFTHSVPSCLSSKKLHLCLNKAALGNNGISCVPLLLAKAESIRNLFYGSHAFDSFSYTVCHVVLFLLTLKCLCCWRAHTCPFHVPAPFIFPPAFLLLFFLNKTHFGKIGLFWGVNGKEGRLYSASAEGLT